MCVPCRIAPALRGDVVVWGVNVCQEIATLLLEAGADPTVKNSDGESALDVAQPTLKRKMEAALEKRGK